jgi:hypothetical protein
MDEHQDRINYLMTVEAGMYENDRQGDFILGLKI